MEEAAEVRRAALKAVDDVEPAELQTRIDARITDGSMSPGVLTIHSARVAENGPATEHIADRAAGVQLIYEGLRLTRSLAHDAPWATLAEGSPEPGAPDAGTEVVADPGHIDADLDILVADILVSRGFYVLARTEAASAAVATVRQFGRDQTRSAQPARDRGLEVDVFELAVIAGVTATGRTVPDGVRSFAADLVPTEGPLPDASAVCAESALDGLVALIGPESPATDGVFIE
jgi:hypothetical protein